MATASVCGPCFAENKTLKATKFCSDCEERLCSSCTESHDRFKAFKSHHVIDLSSVDNKIPISVTKCCKIHTELLLDYFCTDHDIICCRACIPNDHRTCQNILPLEFASKNVKTSALYTDVIQEIKHLLAILNKFNDNRQSNLELLAKSKLAITNRISELKVQLLKQIDTLELDLHSTLSSFQLKHETGINKQKEEISQMMEILKSKENEIEVVKDCGSNNHLFIALHEQVSDVQTAADKVQQMISSSQEVDISLDEYKNVKMEFFGSLLENVKPCQVQYKPLKFQQAQSMAEPTQGIVGFDKDTDLELKLQARLNLIDVAITEDNKLLLTNFNGQDPTLYVYKECKEYERGIRFTTDPRGVAVITSSHRAVVTLPTEKSIRFINTKQMKKEDKVNVGFVCLAVTAGRDRIYVGGTCGTKGSIKTLDTTGTILQSINHGDTGIYFLLYDDIHEQFIVRCENKLSCGKLDGTIVFSKNAYGIGGLTFDRQGNFYFGCKKSNIIKKMSPDGENCEEMLNKDNGINNAYGMCFNNDFTKLYVINNHQSVDVFKCK
ncbi:TRIM66 [Mytilus edulis]|uniref:TRIM66 n=1 Tax=Mytilus edulis TaxID=6550 RepID=A0A8S3PU32_MYTED|nr:TRIM66 [Mytilus edulis]